MIVFFNGEFVPEEKAVVSVFDRNFLYGDGLFETLRVVSGRPFRWDQHLVRLQRGIDFLGFHLPFEPGEIRGFADELIRRNRSPEAVLRIVLSRGTGPRGYSPKGAGRPVLVMSLHPARQLDQQEPPRWRLITSSFRLQCADPLAHFKTCNRLPQILARAQAEASGADEALLLNTKGEVAETASSNLFWIERAVVCTPPITSGALPGVTRALILEICAALGLPTREASARPEALPHMDGLFLTVSSWGIIEATTLDNQQLGQSPVVQTIREAYQETVRRECLV